MPPRSSRHSTTTHLPPEDPLPAKSTKRGRKPAIVEATDDGPSDTEVVPSKKRKGTAAKGGLAKKPLKAAAAARVQPSRPLRNEHPGVIAKPRVKRTLKEVAAEKAHKAQTLHELEELEVKKCQLLAEMEISEEEHAAEREARSVRWLSAMYVDNDSDDHGDGEDNEQGDEGEYFPMDIDESSRSESSDEPVPVVQPPKTVSTSELYCWPLVSP